MRSGSRESSTVPAIGGTNAHRTNETRNAPQSLPQLRRESHPDCRSILSLIVLPCRSSMSPRQQNSTFLPARTIRRMRAGSYTLGAEDRTGTGRLRRMGGLKGRGGHRGQHGLVFIPILAQLVHMVHDVHVVHPAARIRMRKETSNWNAIRTFFPGAATRFTGRILWDSPAGPRHVTPGRPHA